MAIKELRFRQIHMDFHTSEQIKNVGKEFNADEFASTLDKARVNSVTCFARCHHGWLYYNSKKFPEIVHPNLTNKNLLLRQIEACHKRKIRVPIYISVQYDRHTAINRPEWCIIDEDGRLSGYDVYKAGFSPFLCVNTPYRNFLKEITKEVLDTFPTDGLFFDIVTTRDCSCKYCLEKMIKKDFDPSKKEERIKYAKMIIADFKVEMSSFIRKFNKECAIFYNAGHIGPYIHESKDAYSHFELESLPSGGRGYVHFPLTIRYARNFGIDCLGQTGRFHTTWGDFHSFKNREALEYECFNMLALNAKCMIGDQLHPNGKICKYVYKLVGSVYSQVEKKEPWCKNARAVTEIGVLNPEEFVGDEIPDAAAGAVRILEEGSRQFDILDTKSELKKYKLIILPDNILISEKFKKRLKKYIASDGKVIATFESGLRTDKSDFAMGEFGVKLRENPCRGPEGKLVRGKVDQSHSYAEYIIPAGEIGNALFGTEYVMYMKGVEVENRDNAEVLLHTIKSYFDRSWEHFCSHKQTPSSGESDYPAVVKKNNIIYFAHPVFSQYNENAPEWCKKIMLNAIDMLLPAPILRHNGPSTLKCTVNEQTDENRWIIHLLHYIPVRICKDIDIIKDVIPLYNLKLSVKTSKGVKSVSYVPESKALAFEKNNGRIVFTLPELRGHQMIEIKFE